MNPKPTFSIIIPVYNTGKYLLECVKSIINQDFSDFEIILVDDGSTDNSFELMTELSAKDNRIKIFHKVNGGLTSTRKFGCTKAAGDYIINVDSDDFLLDGYLSSIVLELQQYNYPDVLAVGFTRVDNRGKELNKINNLIKPGLYINEGLKYVKLNYLYSKDLKGLNYGCLLFSTCAKIVKKNVFIYNQELVPNEIKYGEDLVMTAHLLNSISSLAVSSLTGYAYRASDTSMMVHLSPDSLATYQTTIEFLFSFFADEINKVYIYSERSLCDCLAALARTSKTFSEFKQAFRNTYKYNTIWSFSKKAKYRMSLKDTLRKIALRHRIKFVFYVWFKGR